MSSVASTSTAESALVPELQEFCKGLHQAQEFETGANQANRVSVRDAVVQKVEVVKSSNPLGVTYFYIVLDLAVEKDRELLDTTLGSVSQEGSPDFSTRIRRKPTHDERGTVWQHTIEFVRDPKLRMGSKSTIMMRGMFDKLRLYHVLDLVRIVTEEFKAAQPARSELPFEEQLNDEDFVLAVACILQGFSTEWEKLSDAADFSKCHLNLLDTLNVSQQYYGRWAKAQPESPVSLATFLSSNDQPALHLHRRPKDRGPSFHIKESEDTFVKRLERLARTSRTSPMLQYSMAEFCNHVLRGSDPPEAYAKIISVKRYQVKQGLKHQFVVIQGQLSDDTTIHLRLDRGAKTETVKRGGSTSSSILPPDDKVAIAWLEAPLLWEGETNCGVLSSTHYGPEYKSFNVRKLAKVLDVFRQESKNYILITQNCWYLASIVQEIIFMLSQPDGTGAPLPGTTWSMKVATGTTQRIMNGFDEIDSDNSSDEEEPNSNSEPSPWILNRSLASLTTDESASNNTSRSVSLSPPSNKAKKSFFAPRKQSKKPKEPEPANAFVEEPGSIDEDSPSDAMGLRFDTGDPESAASPSVRSVSPTAARQASKWANLAKKLTIGGAAPKRGMTMDSQRTVTSSTPRSHS